MVKVPHLTLTYFFAGTTVNTAVRMEDMAEPDRIHVSESTANLLVEAGKKKWVQPRKEKVIVKGTRLLGCPSCILSRHRIPC